MEKKPFVTKEQLEEIVKKYEENTYKHCANIFPGHLHQLLRRLQQVQDHLHSGINDQIDHTGYHEDKYEGQADVLPQPVFLSRAVVGGKECPAAHAKSDDDGGNKNHKCVR